MGAQLQHRTKSRLTATAGARSSDLRHASALLWPHGQVPPINRPLINHLPCYQGWEWHTIVHWSMFSIGYWSDQGTRCSWCNERQTETALLYQSSVILPWGDCLDFSAVHFHGMGFSMVLLRGTKMRCLSRNVGCKYKCITSDGVITWKIRFVWNACVCVRVCVCVCVCVWYMKVQRITLVRLRFVQTQPD
jgi:hypothetical protein